VTTPDGLPPLREVIASLQLSAKRSLGQNFILDLNLTRRIARAGGSLEGKTVIEVGPGPGGLTRALLLEESAKVIVVERDSRCLPALEQIADHYPGKLHIVSGDALEQDVSALAGGPCRIIANLPYGVATALLTRWLTLPQWPPAYDRLILMFQREVAERIVAEPGSRNYGRLSVLSHWRSQPRILFNLPPQAFTPPPKVASALVELVPVQNPLPAGSIPAFEAVTAAAFGQRRKMIKSSLRSLGADTDELLDHCGITSTLRAEQVTVEQFCALAQAYHDLTG